jgi:hypothetical protein
MVAPADHECGNAAAMIAGGTRPLESESVAKGTRPRHLPKLQILNFKFSIFNPKLAPPDALRCLPGRRLLKLKIAN